MHPSKCPLVLIAGVLTEYMPNEEAARVPAELGGEHATESSQQCLKGRNVDNISVLEEAND